jgi:hypothetical protein
MCEQPAHGNQQQPLRTSGTIKRIGQAFLGSRCGTTVGKTAGTETVEMGESRE